MMMELNHHHIEKGKVDVDGNDTPITTDGRML
jgi:hypothetical protein